MKSRIINTVVLLLVLLTVPLYPLSASLFANDSFRQQPVRLKKNLQHNQVKLRESGRAIGLSHKPFFLTSVQLLNNVVNIYQDRNSLIYYFLQTSDPVPMPSGDPYNDRIIAMEAFYGRALQLRYIPGQSLLEVSLGGKRSLRLPLIYTPSAIITTEPDSDGFHSQWAVPLQEDYMEQLLQGMICIKNQATELEGCATGSLISDSDYNHLFISYFRHFPVHDDQPHSTGIYNLSYRYSLVTFDGNPRVRLIALPEAEPEDADNGQSTGNDYTDSLSSNFRDLQNQRVNSALAALKKNPGKYPGGDDGPHKKQQQLTRSHYIEANEMERILKALLTLLSTEKQGYNKLSSQIHKVLGSINTLKQKSLSYQKAHQASLQSEYQQVLETAAASDPVALTFALPQEAQPDPTDITIMDESEISQRIDQLPDSDNDDN